MKIQSVSISVPNIACINKCKFCVSRMRCDEYENRFADNKNEYRKRLEFCRDNGANTALFTGTSEPTQNPEFLLQWSEINNSLPSPFKWLELQCTGAGVTYKDLKFYKDIGITTIAISIASPDDRLNNQIIGTSSKNWINLEELCKMIKQLGFILRLSINLNSKIWLTPYGFFELGANLGASQITFRKLYTSGKDTEQDRWIKENEYPETDLQRLHDYIKEYRPLRMLDFGATIYDIYGISTVLDSDCMAQQLSENLKYLILREDCHLYSHWDTKASLIF